MKSQDKQQLDATRSEFISVLGHEYMLATGHGMYAHLTHIEINKLFEQFLAQSDPAKAFARRVVRKI